MLAMVDDSVAFAAGGCAPGRLRLDNCVSASGNNTATREQNLTVISVSVFLLTTVPNLGSELYAHTAEIYDILS